MKGMNGILDYSRLFTIVYLQLLQLLYLKIIYFIHVTYFFSHFHVIHCSFFIPKCPKHFFIK